MKRILLLLFLTLCSMVVFAQQADTITAEWIQQHYIKREVKIEMRDGVHLFTAIYEPKDKSVKHPVIMNRTCYGIGPYGEDKFMGLHRPAWAEYARNGYIFVFQDVRGKNMSEGVFEDIRPFIEGKSLKKAKAQRKAGMHVDIDEASDTYDTAEWIVRNTNNNGNIGVFGISYPGFYSTMAGLSGHPAIKAVSPQAPVTDWFRGDDVHHNGALFIWDMHSFIYWFEYLNVASNRVGEWGTIKNESPAEAIKHTDAYNDYLGMGAVKNFTALFGDSVHFWNDMVEHPDLDDWWEARNVTYHCKNIKPAVMIVGGLFDAEDCYGAFATYNAIKSNSPKTDLYLVEGPWAHGMWGRGANEFFGNVYFGEQNTSDYYLKNIEYPFFAYYLEGKGDKPKAVRVLDSGSCTWREYDSSWPINTNKKAFVLEGGATYVSDPAHPVPCVSSPEKNRPAEYMVSDQRFASTRPDVAVFTYPVLTDTMQLSGEVEAELEVSITTTDADFIVKIIDVFPDDFAYPDSLYHSSMSPYYNMSGYQMLVRGEVMRGKYRNSFSSPEPFIPNQRTKVKFRMPDVAHTFLPGHRLMIQVQSSWFPLVDRNPQKFCNIYKCDDSDFQKSTITIYPESKVWLPVVNK